MPSLLEALEKKYNVDCHFDNDLTTTTTTKASSATTVSNNKANNCNRRRNDSISTYDIVMDDTHHGSDSRLISVFIPRVSPLKLVPELLVLNDCDIDCAGNFETIKDKCQRVRELDLAQNKLRDWNEVFHILKHMPRIEFLNLSKNQLMGPIADYYAPASISNLRSIVLNGTYLDWHCIDMLLEHLPILEELHLSLNDYREVLIDTNVPASPPNADNNTNNASLSPSPSPTTNNPTNNANANANDCACSDASSDAEANETSSSSTPHNNHLHQTTSSKYRQRSSPHTALKTLHFTGNPIESWTEVCRLGRVFPSLQNLVLAQCPIKTLQPTAPTTTTTANEMPSSMDTQTPPPSPPPSSSSSSAGGGGGGGNLEDDDCPYRHFGNLRFLNLSCANINTWDDIDRIARFPQLHHVRVKNWPLWDRLECTEHERRQLLIARLPNVSLLNGGGVISADEREDAERAFIRYYMDKPLWERPKRYDELVAKHGRLDPLVNVNLKPDKRVKVLLTFQERTEARLVDIYRTVADLKVRLEKVVGLAPNKMRLYYLDQDYKEFGPEEMKFPNKMLYSYNIQPGDEIIIDEKK